MKNYNGIVLPDLPEWDSATYPVAVIVHCISDDAISVYGAEYILGFGTRTGWNNGKLYLYGLYQMYNATDTEWVYKWGSGTASVLDIDAADFSKVIWTNTDIATEDGTGVYLAASGNTSNMKAFVKMLLCGLVSKGVVKGVSADEQ